MGGSTKGDGKSRTVTGREPRDALFPAGSLNPAHDLRGFLLRGTFGGVGLKLLSIALAFGISVLLARRLGPEGYGVYSYVLSLVMLFTVPARFGLTSLVIRETVRAGTQANWPLLRGLWRWSDRWVSLSSLIMMVLGLIGLGVFADRLPQGAAGTAIWGLLLIPALAMLALRGAALQGLRRVIIGQMPDLVLRQALFLFALLPAMLISPGWLDPERAMLLHVGAAMTALLIAMALRRQARPSALATARSHAMKVGEWLRSALPLALAEGSRILHMQIGIILIGWYHTPDRVGLYQVAAQLSVFVSFLLAPVGQAISPDIARLFHGGETGKVARLVKWGAISCGGSALIIAALFILFGRTMLSGLYSEDFIGAYPALIVLCLNYFVISVFGPIGPVLNMIGRERVNLQAAMAGTLVNIVLCIFLIPAYSMVGAAISLLVSGIVVGSTQIIALMDELLVHRRTKEDG